MKRTRRKPGEAKRTGDTKKNLGDVKRKGDMIKKLGDVERTRDAWKKLGDTRMRPGDERNGGKKNGVRKIASMKKERE